MRYIPTGTFKARCLALMKKVQATGEPVIVTKRGKPVVKIVPAHSEKNDLFGFLSGKVKIVGDIESPVPAKWESAEK
jgi:prevent-host-death family protein